MIYNKSNAPPIRKTHKNGANLFDHNRGSSNDAVIPSSTVVSLKGGHLEQSNKIIFTHTRIKIKKYLIGTDAGPHAFLPPLPLKDHVLLPTTYYA